MEDIYHEYVRLARRLLVEGNLKNHWSKTKKPEFSLVAPGNIPLKIEVCDFDLDHICQIRIVGRDWFVMAEYEAPTDMVLDTTFSYIDGKGIMHEHDSRDPRRLPHMGAIAHELFDLREAIGAKNYSLPMDDGYIVHTPHNYAYWCLQFGVISNREHRSLRKSDLFIDGMSNMQRDWIVLRMAEYFNFD